MRVDRNKEKKIEGSSSEVDDSKAGGGSAEAAPIARKEVVDLVPVSAGLLLFQFVHTNGHCIVFSMSSSIERNRLVLSGRLLIPVDRITSGIWLMKAVLRAQLLSQKNGCRKSPAPSFLAIVDTYGSVVKLRGKLAIICWLLPLLRITYLK